MYAEKFGVDEEKALQILLLKGLNRETQSGLLTSRSLAVVIEGEGAANQPEGLDYPIPDLPMM